MTPTIQPYNSADHLPCDGIWGGNKNACHDIRTSGLTVSVYSRASDGAEGGDICYVAICKKDMLARIAMWDVLGHGSNISPIASSIYRVRKSVNSFRAQGLLRTEPDIAAARLGRLRHGEVFGKDRL